MSLNSKTSELSTRLQSLLPMSGVEDSHAKTFRSQEWDHDQDLLEKELVSFTILLDCLSSTAPELFSSKTLQGFSAHMKEETLPSLPARWPSSGILSDGVYLTANTSEYLNQGSECSLLGVIETGRVHSRYFLNPTAAQGILRRTDRMGRNLFPPLRKSLEGLAQKTQSSKK
jgi:hypothetical protein|nr:hypothetical protein [Limnohabitans sp.]